MLENTLNITAIAPNQLIIQWIKTNDREEIDEVAVLSVQ